ncbi:alanine racemase [Rhizobium sp. BK650]|uniref:alanine racemase n=1 Tax=Rhizobium sp. BK650 TaxID=2586990 RepID=UPI0016115F82|nr:alanine racemase [Rhizobium sp. BK650]MBB3659723.1 alanine racemase [Rhizobium sp. BK650]
MRPDDPEVIIDLNAIQMNFAIASSMAGPDVDIGAVVKSDGYGLGLESLIEPLVTVGCRSFFVADLSEAYRVRERAKGETVVILAGMKDDHVEHYRKNRFVPVCNTLAEALTAAEGRCDYALNLETGFSRFGLEPSDVRSFIHRSLPPPVLAMSHLACADEPANSLNELQKNRFISLSELLGPTRRSLAASAGLFLGPAYLFDLVRLGSALYGLNTANLTPNPFRNVLKLRACLVDVRHVHVGGTVGYKSTFRASRPTRLGILSIGYAHGLAWSLSNRMTGEIGSHLAPLVGRVSMEYVAVDLTDVPEQLCQPGQWVELITHDRPVEDMAHAAATVAQEVMLRIGVACRRSYAAIGSGQDA